MIEAPEKITYEQALAWWNSKTPEQKFAVVGVDVIDKWVREILEQEFKDFPPPVSAISVIKSLSK